MFKTVEELKEFIEWAKTQQIQKVKLKGVEVEFSPYTFLPNIDTLPELSNGGASTLADLEPVDPTEEEELLFHSSNI